MLSLKELSADPALADIEDVIARSAPDRRVHALQRLTDHFVSAEPELTKEQADVFNSVFQHLVENIEKAARIRLSAKLADKASAPHGIVRGLAFDEDIQVAGPVLERSKALRDEDLIHVAETYGNDHLLAVARRESLTVAVTDVLVERGDHEVIRVVAANEGAKLSRDGFRRLIDRAKGDADLQETIGTRPDLPDDCYPRLLAQATESVVRRLAATRLFEDPRRLRSVAHEVADRFAILLAGDGSELSGAMTEVLALRNAGGLDERTLRDFARRRQPAHILAATSLVCNLSLAATKRLFAFDSLDPLVVVAKANNIGWLTLRDMLRASYEHGATETALAQAFDNYTKTTRETAQRVIRFWQVRDPAMRPRQMCFDGGGVDQNLRGRTPGLGEGVEQIDPHAFRGPSDKAAVKGPTRPVFGRRIGPATA